MQPVEPKRAAIQQLLLAWFREHGRDLPWRRTRDPYHILVSEVMLQQTQVDRVIPKYEAFLARFSSVQALAEAPVAEVIRAWQGLGYNRRAVNLQRAAQAIVSEHGGRFPETPEELQQLPGIGAYTAGAVACFAFERPVAFLDTNIRRVVRRLFCGPDELQQPGEAELIALARAAVPADQPWSWNQALMELGALVCTATTPGCWRCPLRSECASYSQRQAADSAIFAAAAPSLLAQPAPAARRTRRVKETAAFTSTSRYFRGRIVDVLRALPAGASISLAELGPQVKQEFEQAELSWLARLVDGLAQDGLAAWHNREGAELAAWRAALP